MSHEPECANYGEDTMSDNEAPKLDTSYMFSANSDEAHGGANAS